MVLQHEFAMTGMEATWRAPAAEAADDMILPFEVAPLDLRGRVVRLGPALDEILNAHAYPAAISKLLGEAIVLTVLLGSSLKFDGRFILQTKTDGPVRMLVVDYRSPGRVRACAQFDPAADRRRRAQVGRRTARPRPSRHDDRPGPGDEPLPGLGRARRRKSRRCRA